MKKLIVLFAFVLLSFNFQSCIGLAAGVINRQIINSDKDEVIENRLTILQPIALSEEQKEETRVIFSEEITKLKENARKEKTKEISNKASAFTFVYEDYKSQVRFEKLLDKKQLLKYRGMILTGDVHGTNEKGMLKLKKKLKRKGYKVDFN